MSKATVKEVVYPVTVQFEDVDSYKIVHHTKLITFLERARVQFFRELGYDLFDNKKEMVLYNLNITFKKTAKFLDDLVVNVSIISVESFRFTLSYRITKEHELIAKAETDIAFVDSKTKEIIPVPEEFTL
jgi:acyl-CoA thioester hydrolase